ncbi:hypothetical protein [Streptomyces sp. NPDC097619]|uniref:hypothetical protein n=1 Tax=Streptomyces sp. NPDC097619 TaxID=3157228 RepID=UPI00331B882D
MQFSLPTGRRITALAAALAVLASLLVALVVVGVGVLVAGLVSDDERPDCRAVHSGQQDIVAGGPRPCVLHGHASVHGPDNGAAQGSVHAGQPGGIAVPPKGPAAPAPPKNLTPPKAPAPPAPRPAAPLVKVR